MQETRQGVRPLTRTRSLADGSGAGRQRGHGRPCGGGRVPDRGGANGPARSPRRRRAGPATSSSGGLSPSSLPSRPLRRWSVGAQRLRRIAHRLGPRSPGSRALMPMAGARVRRKPSGVGSISRPSSEIARTPAPICRAPAAAIATSPSRRNRGRRPRCKGSPPPRSRPPAQRSVPRSRARRHRELLRDRPFRGGHLAPRPAGVTSVVQRRRSAPKGARRFECGRRLLREDEPASEPRTARQRRGAPRTARTSPRLRSPGRPPGSRPRRCARGCRRG